MTFLNTVVILCAIGWTALGMLGAELSFARAAAQRNASQEAAAGLSRASALLLQRVSSAIAQGASPRGSFSGIDGSDSACAGNADPCDYLLQETFRVTSGAANASACVASANCAQNLEANALVSEGRLSATIQAAVLSGGDVVYRRSDAVTLRTFAQPPYAMFSGSRPTSADWTSGASEGDQGGVSSSMFVRAAYLNTQTGTLTDASSFASSAWANGNVTSGAWRP
ncbi:MAG: hypothetical protein M3Y18_08595 [Candidatus Eremiobacteraeota bacterium]|nr:hypothetical protein [Candidatus Eremiobacteraeota bacterium]